MKCAKLSVLCRDVHIPVSLLSQLSLVLLLVLARRIDLASRSEVTLTSFLC